MSDDNTKPEFFALWSVRQLQVECARLNQLLKEVIEISEKSLEKPTLMALNNPKSGGYPMTKKKIPVKCLDELLYAPDNEFFSLRVGITTDGIIVPADAPVEWIDVKGINTPYLVTIINS